MHVLLLSNTPASKAQSYFVNLLLPPELEPPRVLTALTFFMADMREHPKSFAYTWVDTTTTHIIALPPCMKVSVAAAVCVEMLGAHCVMRGS